VDGRKIFSMKRTGGGTMKSTLVHHLAKKIFNLLALCGLVVGTFCGGSSIPVQAKVLAENTGEGVAVTQPDFYVWLAYDGSLWDITGYNWPPAATVTMTLDNKATPANPDFTRVAITKEPWNFDMSGLSALPGDVVTMTDGSTHLTHTITALHVTQVNAITDIVTGTAAPGSEVMVNGEGGWAGIRWETAAANGTWKADFSKPGDKPEEVVADVHPGLNLHITQSNGSGTTAYGWRVPDPWFWVFLGKDGSLRDIHGYDWALDTPVVMTLDNPPYNPGTPDFTRVAYMEEPPWGGDKQLVYDISGMSAAPGAKVTMTDGITTYLTHTVTNLHVTDVDPDTDMVTGTADPFSEVRVGGNNGWSGNRHETAASNGSWTADFSQAGDEPGEDVADIHPGMNVISNQENGGGTTAVVWDVPNDEGVITGTVHDLRDTPITGVRIDVTANFSYGSSSTCSDAATGTYQITGLPLNDPIMVSANANGGCDNNNFGWELWQHVTVQAPTPITLTDSSRVASGINFSLGSIPRGIEYFFFNLNTPALSDKAVRTAIAYGTDRQRMLDQAWRPAGITGTVQNSYLPDDQWGHAPDSALTLYPYDPDLARSTLATAGWIDSDQDGVREKNGQELSLSFKTTWLQARQENGALFVADMQAIGIHLTPHYLNPSLFNAWPDGSFWKSDFDIAELATSSCGSLEDTTCVPYSMFVTGDPYNVMGYNSIPADTLYSNAQTASTLEDKRYFVIQHQVIISQDLPVLPLFKKIPGYLTCLPLVIR
jgi:hypothetical protein